MLLQPTFVLKERNILSFSQGIFEQNLVWYKLKIQLNSCPHFPLLL